MSTEDEEPMTITVTDGPGNMPIGRMLQAQADAEREYAEAQAEQLAAADVDWDAREMSD